MNLKLNEKNFTKLRTFLPADMTVEMGVKKYTQ